MSGPDLGDRRRHLAERVPGPDHRSDLVRLDEFPERGEVWYSDANSGFWVLRLNSTAWPDAGTVADSDEGDVQDDTGGAALPATGAGWPIALGIGLLVAALVIRPRRRRSAS